MTGRNRIVVLILALVLIPLSWVLAGGSAEAEPEETAEQVAVVFGRGGLGDESFNDAAFRGLQRAGEELGIEYDYAEPQAVAEFEPLLTQFAAQGSYSLIISIGFEQGEALNAVSQAFPDQEFAIIDTVVEQPNVTSYVYEEQERGFLMGAAAALTTVEADNPLVNPAESVAVIGGVESPLINANIAGFLAGAQYINPDIDASFAYVGSFGDPARGKEIAISMIEAGADVVWGAAGRSGLGVLDAAMEMGVYGMGADSDQGSVAPGHVLSNGIKLVDETVYIAIDRTLAGEPAGGLSVLGVADGALGYTDSLLSDAALSELEAVREAIIAGEFDIPATIEEARAE